MVTGVFLLLLSVVIQNAYSLSFNGIEGYWRPLCIGCSHSKISIEKGVSSGSGSKINSEYSQELSSSISAGFSFFGAEGSVEVSGSIGSSLSREIESSLTEKTVVTVSMECANKKNLFQWIISGNEVTSNSNRFFLHTLELLCVEIADPSCIPGLCNTDGTLLYSKINVYGWYSKTMADHYFNTDRNPTTEFLINNGYERDASALFSLYDTQAPGTIALYSLYSEAYHDHMISMVRDEAYNQGYIMESILGFCYPKANKERADSNKFAEHVIREYMSKPGAVFVDHSLIMTSNVNAAINKVQPEIGCYVHVPIAV